jgi:hypothetical protein
MSALDDLIQKYCSNGVEFKELGHMNSRRNILLKAQITAMILIRLF